MNNIIKKIITLLLITSFVVVTVIGYFSLSIMMQTIDDISEVNETTLKQYQQQLSDIQQSIDNLNQSSTLFELRISKLEENINTPDNQLPESGLMLFQSQLDKVQNEIDHLKQASVNWEMNLSILSEKVNQYIETSKQPAALSQSVTPSTSKTRPDFPYQIIGTELRGNQQFITIAPVRYKNIADIRLIRQGETIGVWALTKLNHNSVIFKSGKYQHEVSF